MPEDFENSSILKNRDPRGNTPEFTTRSECLNPSTVKRIRLDQQLQDNFRHSLKNKPPMDGFYSFELHLMKLAFSKTRN